MANKIIKFLNRHIAVVEKHVPIKRFIRSIPRGYTPTTLEEPIHRIVFVRAGGRGRITLVTFHDGKTIRKRYDYRSGKRRVTIDENVKKDLVLPYEEHAVVLKDKKYYPVLDGRHMPVKKRVIDRGVLKGLKEAIIPLSSDVFDALRDDLVSISVAKTAAVSIKRGMSGKPFRLSNAEKKALRGIINVIKETNGTALIAIRDLSPDEIDMIEEKMEKHLPYMSRSARGILRKIIYTSLISGEDEAIERFHSILKHIGIKESPQNLRRWRELAKGDHMKRKGFY
ncbi:MAG: hypothetical protein J7K68_01510 [Candidatus Diapherotrites archaeon]|nr:hypothetical protein [Candidatus Diapherotrites archaeon]